MDVSELLAPGPGLSTTTIVLIAVAIFGGVLAIAGVLITRRRPGSETWLNWLIAPGVVLLILGCLGGMGSAHEDKPDRGAMLESALFGSYGFNVERPTKLWSRISDAGESGTVTKLSREGVEQDVRVRLDGTRLVITGPDGKEIPTNP